MLPASPIPASSAQSVLNRIALERGTPGPAAGKAGSPTDRARETAEGFEAVFVSSMLKQMFSGLKTDGPFGGGYGEEVFREMLADEYAKGMVEAGGIGLADQVYREILALQEVSA